MIRLRYNQCSDARGFNTRSSFLHLGVNQCLVLKFQVSALTILFQRLVASHSLFMEVVTHVAPPCEITSATMVFESFLLCQLGDSPLLSCHEVAFLVTITSARQVSELMALTCEEPFLVFQKILVILRAMPSALPKVNPPFYLNRYCFNILVSGYSLPKEDYSSLSECGLTCSHLSVSFNQKDLLSVIPENKEWLSDF